MCLCHYYVSIVVHPSPRSSCPEAGDICLLIMFKFHHTSLLWFASLVLGSALFFLVMCKIHTFTARSIGSSSKLNDNNSLTPCLYVIQIISLFIVTTTLTVNGVFFLPSFLFHSIKDLPRVV